MKKFIALIALLMSFVLFVSCGGTNSGDVSDGGNSGSHSGQSGDEDDFDVEPSEPGEIDFWSASTAETVLYKKAASNYEGIREPARINVSMAKNEYEGAQLFLTATKAVWRYDLEISDLRSSDGTVFSKNNVDLYAYKYVTVSSLLAGRQIGSGLYPDAVMPFETTKKFRENKIEQGANQGVYVRFRTSAETKAGTYTGSLTVTYDGKTRDIPVTLNVWDIAVPEENHLKTIFLIGWSYQTGEQSQSYDKYYDYVDVLRNYRLSPLKIISVDTRYAAREDYWDIYAQKAYEFTIDPMETAYQLIYFDGTSSSFDQPKFEEMLMKLAEKSCYYKVNLFQKAVANFNTMIDEATMQGKLSETIAVTNQFRSAISNVSAAVEEKVSAWANEYGVTQEYVQSIADAVIHIPHLFVSNYDADYSPYIENDEYHSGVWCPNVWDYQDPKNEDIYTNQLKVDWWYGCGGSNRLIPSYQTDDYTLSPRIMSWQQMYYGITGNLYWGVDYWQTKYGSGEDFYDTNALVTDGVNGDGWLVYPGAPYELDKPVATRRLEAIRDGMEEYEILLLLKNKYAEICEKNGMENTFDDVYKVMTQNIFQGINIISTAEDFDTARNLMAALTVLANSGAEAVLKQLEITSSSIKGQVYLKNGYTLKCGSNAVNSVHKGEGNIWYFDYTFNDYHNDFTFTVPELEGTNSFSIVQNGKATLYAPNDATVGEFTSENATIEKTLMTTGAAGIESETENVLKLDVSAVDGKLQSFKMKADHISGLGKTTSGIKFVIYNDSGKEQTLKISAKYTNDPILSPWKTVTLKEGRNEISISGVHQKAWNKLGAIDYFRFTFGETTTEPAISGIYYCGCYITYLS